MDLFQFLPKLSVHVGMQDANEAAIDEKAGRDFWVNLKIEDEEQLKKEKKWTSAHEMKKKFESNFLFRQALPFGMWFAKRAMMKSMYEIQNPQNNPAAFPAGYMPQQPNYYGYPQQQYPYMPSQPGFNPMQQPPQPRSFADQILKGEI